MQCVVLAGGLGTRMRPWTEVVPKALLPVNGTPFIDHQLALLAAEGITDVVVCIGHLGEMIQDHVGDGRRAGLRVRYVDEGSNLRGTAGALRLALDEDRLDDAFFVLYGDSYLPISYRPVIARLRSTAAEAVMTVFHNAHSWDSSNVLFRDGHIVVYDKSRRDPRSPDMEHIDYGLAALRRSLIERRVPQGVSADLADLYHGLSQEGRLVGYEVGTRFFEVGSPDGLADLEAELLSTPAGQAIAERRHVEPAYPS